MVFDLLSLLTTVFGVIMSFGYYPQFSKILKRKLMGCALVLIAYLIYKR